MLWFEKWLEWRRWLKQSWHVVLKSAMDQILGVDTLGQHVPSRVRYGTACLLIWNAIGCVCLARLSGDVHHSLCHTCDILCDLLELHGARGALCWEILSTATRALCWGIRSKA
jgi:hypothetical protein